MTELFVFKQLAVQSHSGQESMVLCNLLCTRGSSKEALSRQGSMNKTPLLVSLGIFTPKQIRRAIVYCVRTQYLFKREIIHSNGPIQLIVSIFKIPRVCI